MAISFCVLLKLLYDSHEFEWKREECYMLRKPDPAVLVAITKEPPGRLQTRSIQVLDYNLNRYVFIFWLATTWWGNIPTGEVIRWTSASYVRYIPPDLLTRITGLTSKTARGSKSSFSPRYLHSKT